MIECCFTKSPNYINKKDRMELINFKWIILNMSEKVWYKVAKLIVRACGNPLFKANETLVEILKSFRV
jgi:hypothetical protein